MQGGDGLVRQPLEEGEVDHVGVEMDDVEVVGAVQDGGEQGHVRGQVRLERGRVQADGAIAHRHQLGPGAGISAGKQGDFVAQVHQGICQVGDHPLGSTIKTRGNSLIQR